jgi:hypothetical protein
LSRVIALIPNRFEINLRVKRRMEKEVTPDSERGKSCRTY